MTRIGAGVSAETDKTSSQAPRDTPVAGRHWRVAVAGWEG
jgi:hypothetical protein